MFDQVEKFALDAKNVVEKMEDGTMVKKYTYSKPDKFGTNNLDIDMDLDAKHKSFHLSLKFNKIIDRF